jgi:acyl-CoA synthetase (AMP-forming)/AMP-acid ligase II
MAIRAPQATEEMIIIGGLDVYPREVEMALEGHPTGGSGGGGSPHRRGHLRPGPGPNEARLGGGS